MRVQVARYVQSLRVTKATKATECALEAMIKDYDKLKAVHNECVTPYAAQKMQRERDELAKQLKALKPQETPVEVRYCGCIQKFDQIILLRGKCCALVRAV